MEHFDKPRMSHRDSEDSIFVQTTEEYDQSRLQLTPNFARTNYQNHHLKPNIPADRRKTLIMFFYVATCALISTTAMQITNEFAEHDHSKQPPLRDLLFDAQESFLKENSQPKLFLLAETWGFLQTISFLFCLLFHQHRHVIARRFMFCWGTVYLYRSVTIIVTSLPVPGLHITCQAKVAERYYNGTDDHQESAMSAASTGILIFKTIFIQFATFGMKMTGEKNMVCGDYIFSGHTHAILTSLYFHQRYTPRQFFFNSKSLYKIWKGVITTISIICLFCIILSHEHYTIDVIIAYYFVTRVFYISHAIVDNEKNKEDCKKKYVDVAELAVMRNRYDAGFISSSDHAHNDEENTTHNHLSRVWYTKILVWSEENVNIRYNEGALPFHYQSPVEAFLSSYREVKEYFSKR